MSMVAARRWCSQAYAVKNTDGEHGAEYDETTQRWAAHIRKSDGTARTLRPKHIVVATSVSGTPEHSQNRHTGKF
jgi:hypothetical protein